MHPRRAWRWTPPLQPPHPVPRCWRCFSGKCGAGGGGSLAPKGLLRGRRFSPRGQICPGRAQRGLEPAPTHDGQDFGGRGAHARTPLRSPPCSEAASSSIASTPTPAIQLGTGSKRLAAPSPGRILPYRARTEPWGCPGGSSLPLGGRILLCFFWRKSPASACRKERSRRGPRTQRRYPADFGAHPGGSSPQEDESQGEGGLQQFRAPGTAPAASPEGNGVWHLRGCPGRPPSGASLSFFFSFFVPYCPVP